MNDDDDFCFVICKVLFPNKHHKILYKFLKLAFFYFQTFFAAVDARSPMIKENTEKMLLWLPLTIKILDLEKLFLYFFG